MKIENLYVYDIVFLLLSRKGVFFSMPVQFWRRFKKKKGKVSVSKIVFGVRLRFSSPWLEVKEREYKKRGKKREGRMDRRQRQQERFSFRFRNCCVLFVFISDLTWALLMTALYRDTLRGTSF